MAFTHYTAFTVQSGQVPSAQSNFPVLLKPTDNRFRTTGNLGNVANANGYDLRPYADSGASSALTYELVPGTYSASGGTFEMWVKVPSLDVGSVIYLFYGDSGLSSDGSSTNTWDSNYKVVAHLPDGSSLTAEDSTSNNNDGSITNTTATSGKIDGGASFNGSTTYIDFNSVSMSGGEYTVSFWSTRDTTGSGFSMDSDNGSGSRTVISLNHGSWGGTDHAITTFTGGATADLGSANSIPDALSYIVVTFSDSGDVQRGYVNGSQTGTSTYDNQVFENATSLGTRTSHSGNFATSTIDEFRLSNVVRSANWITTEYNNQNAPGTFYAIGTEQTVSSARFFLLGGH